MLYLIIGSLVTNSLFWEGFFVVVKLGSSFGIFGVSIKRGIKKSGKLLDLIDLLGFSQGTQRRHFVLY